MMFFSNVRFWATAWLVAIACLASEVHAAEVLANPGAPVASDMALSFDGVDDYVSMALPAPLQNLSSNDFTVLTWVRVNDANAFRRILFAQQSTSNFVSIAQNVGNTLYAFVVSNGVQHSVSTLSSVAPGTWVHVAVVWKSADESVSIFINGVQSPTTSGGSSSVGTDGLMTLGSRTGGSQYFSGSLDRLAIYGSALSSAQILRAATQCFYPLGASNSYAFDQGVANSDNTGVTTLPDGSGNAPGTLNGFALTGTASNWVDSSISSACPPPTYIVGGSVSGLAGSGLQLKLNGANDLPIAANGAFQFPAIADGTNYAVTVGAPPVNPAQLCTVTNGAGALAGADVSSVQVTCAAATPPDQPTNPVATPGNGQVTLTWTAPAIEGGSPVTAYRVSGSPGGTCSVSGTPPATTCTIPNLINGTAYTFSVVATNAVGDSLTSAPSSPVTPTIELVFADAGPGTVPLVQGTVGEPYSATIGVSGGLPPLVFSVSGNLPDGLTLDPTTGVISGTPARPGTSVFSVTVTDANPMLSGSIQTKAAAMQSFSITIAASPAMSIPTLSEWALLSAILILAAIGLGQLRKYPRAQ